MAIDSIIFELIRSRDPEERKKGVKALARTEDREALRYLATIYKEDPDPQVRDLALKAGQHIKKRNELAEWGHDMGATAGKLEDVEIKQDRSKKKNTQADNRQTTEAKAMLDKAMDLIMVSDYAQAQELAYDAFELAPNLANDPYYAGLAGEIMGVPTDEALQMLAEGRPEDTTTGRGKRKNKAKRGMASDDEITWTRFFIDSGIYAVITAVCTVIMVLMVTSNLTFWANNGMVEEINAQIFYEYGIPDAFPSDYGTQIADAATMIAIGVGLGAAFAGLLGLYFQYGVIHFAATSFLDGVGSFKGLFNKMLLPNMVSIIANTIILSVMVYLFSASMDSSANLEANFGIIDTLGSVSSGLGLLIFVWTAFIIGQNYDFGLVKGCGAIIMSTVLMVVGFCTCAWIFSSIPS